MKTGGILQSGPISGYTYDIISKFYGRQDVVISRTIKIWALRAIFKKLIQLIKCFNSISPFIRILCFYVKVTREQKMVS